MLNNRKQRDLQVALTYTIIILTLTTIVSVSVSVQHPTAAPLPVLPIPTARHLQWHQSELAMFLHFGTNTFTDSEWGDGAAPPSTFSPDSLDARQWATVALSAGFRRLLLTAKHHDGFCLWPSNYTDYSVKASPWRGGSGDVVRDLAIAVKELRLELGLYLSPWDRHQDCYGQTLEYNQFYLAQMTELLTRYAREGDELGQEWVPAECDVSIRPGWFWHPSEAPKSAHTLLDIYYKSVGRNCLLLLNVPPNSSGLISPEDIQVLLEFSELLSSIFSKNLAERAMITASSTRGGGDSLFDVSNVLEETIYTYWAPAEGQSDWMLHVDLKKKVKFNVLQLQEPIQLGQRIISFHVDCLNDKGEWHTMVDGTTIGYKRLLLFSEVETRHLRLVIDQARADPLISFFGVHLDPYSKMTKDDSMLKRTKNPQQIERSDSISYFI
ncbi:putative alpha-L-fucosidase 1 isoform X2 [Silene latifolia]|uniref:putative alpha-L-fucosidase 1 isoform X2 n=1 Tax=Silene latifolia TaxID=37657 RepID=UPI003D788CFB